MLAYRCNWTFGLPFFLWLDLWHRQSQIHFVLLFGPRYERRFLFFNSQRRRLLLNFDSGRRQLILHLLIKRSTFRFFFEDRLILLYAAYARRLYSSAIFIADIINCARFFITRLIPHFRESRHVILGHKIFARYFVLFRLLARLEPRNTRRGQSAAVGMDQLN